MRRLLHLFLPLVLLPLLLLPLASPARAAMDYAKQVLIGHDFAGAISVRHDARECHGRVAPAGAHLRIRGVDAGGMDLHQHLTRAWLG